MNQEIFEPLEQAFRKAPSDIDVKRMTLEALICGVRE